MSDLSKILLAQAKYFRGTENYIIKEALDVYVENEEEARPFIRSGQI